MPHIALLAWSIEPKTMEAEKRFLALRFLYINSVLWSFQKKIKNPKRLRWNCANYRGLNWIFIHFWLWCFFQIRPPLSKHCVTQVTKIGVLIATLLFCRHHVFGNGHWGIFFVKLNSNPEWSLLTIWLPLELKKAICTLLKKVLWSSEHNFSFRCTIVQSDLVQCTEINVCAVLLI